MKGIRCDHRQPGDGKWPRMRRGTVAPALCLSLAAALCALPAFGLINPRFTPADLVRTSSQMLLLKASAPQDKAIAAEIVETLKGTAPAEKKMKFQLDPNGELSEEEVKAAFNGEATAAAVLALAVAENLDLSKDPAGAILIGQRWFAVFKKDEGLVLDTDRQELGAVWAGSARMLAAATRYVQQDPTAAFPVKCGIVWGSELNLGKIPGRANQCIAADLGEPVGLCAIVLADGGDRVYQAAAKGEKPTDVTAKLKLTTASKIAALGDFDGDGRIDLASWNGKTLTLAVRAEDGTFAAGRAIAPNLTECLSMDAIDVGAKAGAGLVVGTRQYPVLVIPDGKGGFTAEPIAGGEGKSLAADMGEGGFCVTADFDGDGRCDVIQMFSKGLLTYAGEAPGRFKPLVRTQVALGPMPTVAICGDYDTDGLLDMVLGAGGRMTLLTREETRQWQDQSYITGELIYHGNANQPKIVGGALSDVNCDGRQGVTFFHSDRKPMSFFNRGFACLGWARELDITGAGAALAAPGTMGVPGAVDTPKPPQLKSAQALQEGQAAGAILDLNDDGIVDMLAVDPKTQEVWILMGENRDNPQPRTLAVGLDPKAAGPVVVTVRDQNRCVGMYVVRPGIPAFIGRPRAGAATIEWVDAAGKPATRKIMAVKSLTRATVP